MGEVTRNLSLGSLTFRWDLRRLTGGAALPAAAFTILVLFDRPLGGILFLAGFILLLDGFGQFHPLFGFLLPLLGLLGAATDAARRFPGAALRWFVGAVAIFALGRTLRRRRLSPARSNPALEAFTAELAALKARRDQGEIGEDEFRARRDAAVAAFQAIQTGGFPPA